MADSDKIPTTRKCSQCGAELPGDLPPELCPKCLLKTGMGTQPATGPGGTVVLPNLQTKARGLPQPGELLGHYRIVRLLGQGGMGAAFEADDLDSGRRVALKVLSHTLDSPEARERFFREGRLAASINHPNSVYVFGTEEIAGTPVIAMELVSGGTLQDRVHAQGPLPTGEAVDCVLQVIAGLEAAQRIGILHRDIKPSNCFCDADGTVKIGDFGLSISTAVRTEPALTTAGAFLGTPAFCSPEQLRGDELNARSDMYSVGATLFYLLTGRTPFEGKTMVQLLATVLEQRAPSPKKFRPNISPGLARAVLRCLEKQPGDRFKNYNELARALAPYSSAAPTPATLGLRFAAGVLDMLVLNVISASVVVLGFGSLRDILELATRGSPPAMALMFVGFGGVILYYGLLEAACGATVGKALCRLRVVGPDNSPPGLLRALARASLYLVVPLLPYWLVFFSNPKAYVSSTSFWHYLTAFSFYLMLGLLFCTVRRRNGFAAVHDLLTRTRVISRTAFLLRPAIAVSQTPPADLQNRTTVGPYHILEPIEKAQAFEWFLGYDLRLLRKVWIRTVPAGTPPLPSSLRSVGRVGRLRWLTGKRSPEENWDAFEALTGQPLLVLAQTRQPWSQVRFWLHDLATEISAAQRDNTLPSLLALDCVWITADGRAKLLDLPAPGAPSNPSRSEGRTDEGIQHSHDKAQRTTQLFLSQVAAAALAGSGSQPLKPLEAVARPLPVHARNFLKSLQSLDAAAAAIAIKPLLQRIAEVSRLRRIAVVAGCLAFPLVACVSIIVGMKLLEQWNRGNPGLMELHTLLQQRAMVNSRWTKNRPHPSDRQFAIYIAHHYSSVITNDPSWSSVFALSLIKGESRRFAEQSVLANPAATEKELAEADAALKPQVASVDGLIINKQPWFPLIVAAVSLAIYVGLPALIAALLFRGGLVLLIAGVTFVRADGERASRLRAFWRAIVAWSPLALTLILAGVLQPRLGSFGTALFCSLFIAGLAIFSLALPTRGLADRLAGTWPVPR